MWQKLPTFVREWWILIAGILLIVPFLYLSSQEASSSSSIANDLWASLCAELYGHPTAATRPPNAEPNSTPASTPTKTAQNSAPAPAKTPVMSHDQKTAAPAQTVGQTAPNAAPAVSGDVAAGKLVFRKCQACHSLDPGKNGIGPSLAGIVGKKSGSAPNFNYSTAMKGQQSHLGCCHARYLSVGSAEVGPRQQDAVSGSEDRE